MKSVLLLKFIEQAERWAKERDSLAANDRGPLHGLPVSVKENYYVKGCDSTSGLAFYAEKPVSEVRLWCFAQLESKILLESILTRAETCRLKMFRIVDSNHTRDTT